jgi:hypothetical protein
MIMKTQQEIEEMAEQAKLATGYDGVGFARLGDPAEEFGLDLDQIRENRAYAEGVEAGLRWALDWANKPLPR